jgi:hypothetical protein
VITAEGAASAGECVFGQVTSLGVVLQGGQVDNEVVRGGQRIWVVGPEGLSAAGECLLVEAAGILVPPSPSEKVSHVVGRGQRVRMADTRCATAVAVRRLNRLP